MWLISTVEGKKRWEEDLARYAQWEYGDSEIGWILSQANGGRKGSKRGSEVKARASLATRIAREGIREVTR